MSNNNTKKSVNVERRTWDVATYEQKAFARQQQQQQQQDTNGLSPEVDHPNNIYTSTAAGGATTLKEEFIPAPIGALGPEGSQRAYLQARKRKVADFIDERVGSATLISLDDAVGTKKQNLDVIGGADTDTIKIIDGVTAKKSSSTSSGSGSGGVGFHCNVCDCYLKDSLTYLDHVNGRKHQRKLGYTMRVERSTESDVLTKLNELKKVKQQHGTTALDSNSIDYDKIVNDKDMDEERRREERQRLRKERRKRHNSHEVDIPIEKEVTEAVQDKKKDNHNNNHDEVADNDDDDEDEEPEAMIDPAMAAMMGFTGFGGT